MEKEEEKKKKKRRERLFYRSASIIARFVRVSGLEEYILHYKLDGLYDPASDYYHPLALRGN